LVIANLSFVIGHFRNDQFQITNGKSFFLCDLCVLRGKIKTFRGIERTNVLKGLSNLANLGTLVKQAQEMGGRMQALQDELRAKRATGCAGGGLVEVDVNGLSEVLAVRIDPTLIARQDREMIEDLLPAAFNAAQQKARQMHAEAMQAIAGGLPITGIPDVFSMLANAGNEPGDKPN
jgi:nucleoid-associated protein EbfC